MDEMKMKKVEIVVYIIAAVWIIKVKWSLTGAIHLNFKLNVLLIDFLSNMRLIIQVLMCKQLLATVNKLLVNRKNWECIFLNCNRAVSAVIFSIDKP